MYTNEISWHVESWADRLKAVQCIYRGSFVYSISKYGKWYCIIYTWNYRLHPISMHITCIFFTWSLKFETFNRLFTPTTAGLILSFWTTIQSFVHSFIRSFHTSLLFKRDSKMIFLNKSCSLSSSNTTEPSSRCKAPQESLKSTSTSSSMAESSSLMRWCPTRDESLRRKRCDWKSGSCQFVQTLLLLWLWFCVRLLWLE